MSTEGSNSSIGVIQAVFLALTLFLAGVHLYLGLLDPSVVGDRRGQFLLIGVAFLMGFLARLSPFWHPILYLLGVAFALFLGVIWLLGDAEQIVVGIVTGIAATAFILLALYLFVLEESRAVGS